MAALPCTLLWGAPPGRIPARQAAAHPLAVDEAGFRRDVLPTVRKFCTCHMGQNPPAGVALSRFPTAASVLKSAGTWEKVALNVSERRMPPPAAPQPSASERYRLAAWVQAALSGAACAVKEPGRVTMRRLNRHEYDNTIRDLAGLDLHLSDDFPLDDVGYGFDNVGDVLSLSPLLMEKYLAAAEKVAAALFAADAKLGAAPRNANLSELAAFRAAPESEKATIARRFIAEFARRAFRRPVTAGEVGRLVGVATRAAGQGGAWDHGMQLAVEATLVSPSFLFRAEPESVSAGRLLGGYELASRLSYALWSTMPDEELFTLAAKGSLQDPQVVEAQARRMLRSPKASALTVDFADQWLQLRTLANANPDPGRFPEFDKDLRAAMKAETESFFEGVVREDRSVLEFLDAPYTYLNERLARHYGIPGVTGAELRRVSLPDGRRGGLVTQAAILTVTSNPTRTSPVKRGRWVLEQLLGAPIPPPPPGLPPLKDDQGGPLKGTLRERMEQHRKDPACASCHSRMDPIGFGLENFDAVGAWRERDGDSPVDSSGVLPDGSRFTGPAELKRVLASRKKQFVRCLAEKLLTYSLGRGLTDSDRCSVDDIVHYVTAHGYRFSALVVAVVRSDPFRMRGPEGGRKA